MNKRGSYAVRISGLGEGDHIFSFELDRQFFGLYEYSDICEGNVNAEVILSKKPGALSLHFNLEGELEVTCDRCLGKFMMGISTAQTIYVKIGEASGEVDDDVLIIGKDEHEIEIGQYLYEFMMLALPYQKVHPDDKDGHPTCDPEMLKKLDAHRAKEPESSDMTDPRWDALKEIFKKN